MLKAEEEGLVNIVIEVMDTEVEQFTGTLVRCVRSMDYGEISTAWNQLREEICQDVVRTHLVPAAAKWVKEHLRGEAEEYVAERCRMELEFVGSLLLDRRRAHVWLASQCPTFRHCPHGARRDSLCPRSYKWEGRLPRRCHSGHARRRRQHPNADEIR